MEAPLVLPSGVNGNTNGNEEGKEIRGSGEEERFGIPIAESLDNGREEISVMHVSSQ